MKPTHLALAGLLLCPAPALAQIITNDTPVPDEAAQSEGASMIDRMVESPGGMAEMGFETAKVVAPIPIAPPTAQE